MKKTSASIILGITLDIIFGLLFMFIIISIQKDKEEITYYMNQIGIYKEQDNANKCINEVKSLDLNGYTYINDDLYVVVTSVTLNKEDCVKEQEILKNNNINFILKEITTSNEVLINALRNNNFKYVMELMSK